MRNIKGGSIAPDWIWIILSFMLVGFLGYNVFMILIEAAKAFE